MGSVLDGFIMKWMTPPFSYLILIIVVVIGCYILFRKLHKEKDVLFKGESIDYVLRELNLKQQFSQFSRACKKGRLYHNLGKVKIHRVMEIKVKLKDGTELKDKEFIAFKSENSLGFLPFIKMKAEYFLVNNLSSYIEKDKYSDTWVIKPKVYMHKYADIWISSADNERFLTDLIYKRTYENAREEEMNYIKRVVWYNDKYASAMTKEHIEHELKQDDFNKRIERETGVKKGG